MEKAKFQRREFKGNVLITISEKEVRLWVCNEKGENIFRFKAMGEVYETDSDVFVLGAKVESS
jgi:hypothetical protein